MESTRSSTGSETETRNISELILSELFRENPIFKLRQLGYEGYLHQAELVYRLMLRRPIRVLIADEIGLGKTIEALMLLKWGFERGLFNRKGALVLVPRSLVGQWREEARRFGFNPVTDLELDSKLAPEHSLFILKIDTVKRDEHKEKVLGREWGVIVVDEAHKLGPDTKRYDLVKKLVEKNPEASVILLSATPHRGDEEQYIRLLELLDGAVKKLKKSLHEGFYAETMNTLVFRRTKREVNNVYEKEKIFVDAELEVKTITLSKNEEDYITSLDKLTRELLLEAGAVKEEVKRAVGLLAVLVDKRGLSSPRAGWLTFDRIRRKAVSAEKGGISVSSIPESLEGYAEEEYVAEKDPDALLEEAEELIRGEVARILARFKERFEYLAKLAKSVEETDSKVRTLLDLLQEHVGKGEKVVVFTEYADTADYIYDKISSELGCEVKKITGRDLEAQGRVEAVIENVKKWLAEPKPRVLVSTDVASEGLNLQYANVLVNYELPWSLVKLEQRIGRVWRLGQSRDVKIYLMLLDHSFEKAVFDSFYRKLAESVKAYIIPSALTILKTKEGLELPASGVVEEAGLKPFEMWLKYKLDREEGLGELVSNYLERLKKRFAGGQASYIYSEGRTRSGLAVQRLEQLLEKTTGFKSREELIRVERKIAKLLGYDDARPPEHLLRKIASAIQEERATYACSGISAPLVILKACVGFSSGENAVCWILVHDESKSGEKRIYGVKELLDSVENAFSSCVEVGRATSKAVEELWKGIEERARLRVENFLREAVQDLLHGFSKYVEATRSSLRPRTPEELRITLFKPLVIAVPLNIVEGWWREWADSSIESYMSVGDITEEKLEVEKVGRSVLEKIL
ncbi:MAG: DEAD/DEAH box helicase, partial [Desulfurococcaceae archaeon]